MKRIAIIGSKDLGQQIKHLISTDSEKYEVVGFYDDFAEKGSLAGGIPILGAVSDIEKDFGAGTFDELLIAIGYNHFAVRKSLYEKFSGKIPFAIFIHSSCIVDSSARIEEGAVLYPGCIIDQKAVIKENALINLGCVISHESEIGKHSYLSPRVAIAGKVQIEECCFLGINATAIDGITIVENTIIGAAASVIKNINESGVYVGSPGRKIKDI
ncbi:acetyltransferase [Riemerella anatipestifer]|nr:acetyltransferase [Riemerella anatipestifer]MDY3325304.1 acetyltransferase [Riemerella anatipestifer]MDY3352706.1 acetyltransferase [Riemerella anatipestifer]